MAPDRNETRHGSLEAGKEASFVVLDPDPLKCDPRHIEDIRVLDTWSRGRCVYRPGTKDSEGDAGDEPGP